MDESLVRFVALYQQLSRDELHRLPEVYANEVVFTDPAHRIEGLAALSDYFAVLYQRLAYCRFVITSQLLQGRQAWLGWTMTFSHPRPPPASAFSWRSIIGAPAGRCGVADAMASGCWHWVATTSHRCSLTGAMQAR